jgi:ADP-heptose:LPS heptosyltransferase
MLDVLDYERIPYVDMIGKTSLAQAVALIKNMDYFAGFASGMTILADVVYQPCLMLYPLHLQKMMYTWPDPMHLANGFHQAHVWDRPSNVYAKIRKHLERFLG